MKPILIHCHIYYHEMWSELKSCIERIKSYPFQLFVTIVKRDGLLEKDIRDTFNNVDIEVIENRGYDVGPFIHIINKVNLDDYSYIVKLHTKRDMPKFV